MIEFTKAQQKALLEVYNRDRSVERSYLALRRRTHPTYGNGCHMVEWKGMFLGIEPDGHVHS